jgi:hypothetical protein
MSRNRRVCYKAGVALFQNVNSGLRTTGFLGAVVLVGWWTVFLRGKLSAGERQLEERTVELREARGELQRREEQLQEQAQELRAQVEENRRLEENLVQTQRELETQELANQLLKVDHRVAKLEILGQGQTPEGVVRTTVGFTELDAEGQPIGEPREVVVEGAKVYVESLVIRFEDGYVEGGDALRGTSLCLFQRLFGEEQKPKDGAPLDAEGQLPHVYGGDTTPSPLHRDLWQRFWDYANDPELARTLGVRALQGEAPFIEVRPGRTYRLELRSSGGLTIQAE